MFSNREGLAPLFSFLQTLRSKGRPLMVNKRLEDCQQLEDSLSLAVEFLSSAPDEVGSWPAWQLVSLPQRPWMGPCF